MGGNLRAAVLLPSFRRGGGQINDHTAPSVDAAGSGVGVGGEDFPFFALKLQGIDIIDSGQVFFHMDLPDTLSGGFHQVIPPQSRVGLIVRTGGVQQHPHRRCRGGPQLENGTFLLPGGPQILTGIGGQRRRLLFSHCLSLSLNAAPPVRCQSVSVHPEKTRTHERDGCQPDSRP